jgi:methylthioribose-1-phosphate isomerase
MTVMYDTVALDEANGALVIIDQTSLPGELKLLSLTRLEQFTDAIKTLKVRGAPAIGVAAAISLYLAVKAEGLERFREIKAALAASRPTAINLFWALDRMEDALTGVRPEAALEALRAEALRIRDEDIQACRAIGVNGLTLLQSGSGVLTHCNAGRLAAVRYGTALAPVYAGLERGASFKVYSCETRPLLQGARLTAYELSEAGVDVTLICDNMASSVMRKGLVQTVITGSDRIAANGDVCNKIGTSSLAILAKYYRIPFIVCAPLSTIDLQTPAGAGIPIEERGAAEVTEMWYSERMAPAGAAVYNPAFDITPAELINAIVTERGIARPPYSESLTKLINADIL